MTLRPPPTLLRPYASPFSATDFSSENHASFASRKLMNPAPAISALATMELRGRAETMACANSRGFLRAALARRIAMLLAKSPWAGSRARSTTTCESSAGAVNTAGTSDRSASFSRRSSSDFTGGTCLEPERTARILPRNPGPPGRQPPAAGRVDPLAGLVFHRRLRDEDHYFPDPCCGCVVRRLRDFRSGAGGRQPSQ